MFCIAAVVMFFSCNTAAGSEEQALPVNVGQENAGNGRKETQDDVLFTVSFRFKTTPADYSGVGADMLPASQQVKQGDFATEPAKEVESEIDFGLVKETQKFTLKFVTTEDGEEEFDFSKPIVKDTVIYVDAIPVLKTEKA